ncbi:hypothetical protein GCM10023208_15730 [Erythrobacter westpacificensis]|uniref:NrtR DNA-binding winged helix domain-containing protein n=2 Tax=Erythrobacter westpacificensis TaxID=1055231 RepID=A0ABP9KB14_9SPHN
MHEVVIGAAVEKLRQSIDYSLKPFSFLSEFFTMPELVKVHEAILGRELVPEWVRRKVIKRIYPGDKMIAGTGRTYSEGPGKPAELLCLRYVSPQERERERIRAKNKARTAKLEREERRRLEAEIIARIGPYGKVRRRSPRRGR